MENQYYYNNIDLNPTLSSRNTILLSKYPYSQFVEQQCDVSPFGTYDTIKYLQIYSFAKPLKIIFYQ